jgi:glycosyltransferase involved in cell wall biosynthesis
MSRRRRVLALAYFFPPLGGAGVQRALKFMKYLPEHGWDPVVVTTRSRWYPARDYTLLSELPVAVPVIRALDPPLLRWAALGFDKLRLDPPRALAAWPDDAAAWVPGALAAALRAVRDHRPDVVLSSSAPWSTHVVALLIQRITGLPWVADFRDEWTANPMWKPGPWPLERLSRRLERAVTSAPARVTVVADYFRLLGSAPRIVIPNGVDDADFDSEPAAPPPDVFRLSFVGTLYGDQSAAPVLAAARRLLERGQLDRQRFQVRVVGNMWLPEAEGRTGPPIERRGYVDHAAAVEEMRSSTALLFYVDPRSRAPSGKLFEYLASERPLLCVARRDNLAWRLVAEWGAGECAEPDDADAIERALLSLWRRWENGTLSAKPEASRRVLERYSRRELSRRLAVVLDEVVRER